MALKAQDLDTGADSPLLAEIRDNDVAGARAALDGGLDPNAPGRNGYRPLHLAAAYGRPGIVSLLIDKGADPNAQSKEGNTPIHYAAMACDSTNFIAAARALVDGGANPLFKDDHGWDAFNLAPPDDNQTAFAMRKFLRGAEKEWRGHRMDEAARSRKRRLVESIDRPHRGTDDQLDSGHSHEIEDAVNDISGVMEDLDAPIRTRPMGDSRPSMWQPHSAAGDRRISDRPIRTQADCGSTPLHCAPRDALNHVAAAQALIGIPGSMRDGTTGNQAHEAASRLGWE